MTSGGVPNTAFGSGGEVTTEASTVSNANQITVLSNGDLVVVGSGLESGDSEESGIVVAEYNPDGSLNTSFSPDGSPAGTYIPPESAFDGSTMYGVAVEPDGAIVTVGANEPADLQAAAFSGGTSSLAYDNNGNTLTGEILKGRVSIATIVYRLRRRDLYLQGNG